MDLYVYVNIYSCKYKYIYIAKKLQNELEQLERLRSEIPPAASWLPILVIHMRSQAKTRQSYKVKKILEFRKKLYTQHTFWSCLIRC